jgi:chemotaxis response regulator CheB
MRIAIASGGDGIVELLRDALVSEPLHQLVWQARSGQEAVARCAEHKPDLLLLEVVVGGIGSLAATQAIMRDTPCPILIVAESIAADSARVFQAMGEGALDVVEMAERGPRQAAALRAKIEMVRKLAGDFHRPSTATFTPVTLQRERMVAIGASAGGPTAVARLISGLPREFPAAIVVVQHLDAQFAANMAEWLRQQSGWPVELAREGDRPKASSVLLAGGSDHLVLKAPDRLGYTPEPSGYPYRPSIDAFFQSVNRYWQGEAVGVLLTGMGRDGSLGLKAMRDKGHHTISQDERSSAVYGMPKAAAKLAAAIDILPIDEIAPRLLRMAVQKWGQEGRAI